MIARRPFARRPDCFVHSGDVGSDGPPDASIGLSTGTAAAV